MFAKLKKNMAFLLLVLIFVFCISLVQSTETQWLNIVKNQFYYGTFMTTTIHPDDWNFNPIPPADANFNCLWEGGFMGYNKKPVWDVNPLPGFWSNVTQNTAVAVATQLHQCFARWAKMYNTKIHALNARQVANSCAKAIPDHHNPLNAEPLCLLRGPNWNQYRVHNNNQSTDWYAWTGDAYCVCLDNIWPRGTGDQRVQSWIPGTCNYLCSGYEYDPIEFPNGGVHPYSWVYGQNAAPTSDGTVIDLHHFDLSQYANFFANSALMVQFNPANCPAMHTWTPGMAPLNPSNCQKGLPSVYPATNNSPVHYYGLITGMTYNTGQFHFTMCTPTDKKYKIQLNPQTAELEYVEDGNMSNVPQPGSNGVPSMGGRPACWNFVVGSVEYRPRAGGGDIIRSTNWPLFEKMAYYWTILRDVGFQRVCPNYFNLGSVQPWMDRDYWPGNRAVTPSSSSSADDTNTTTNNNDNSAATAKTTATATTDQQATTTLLKKEDITPEIDYRNYMREVIGATIKALFADRVKTQRLALQKVKLTTPNQHSHKKDDVVTLEDAQLVEDQVNLPRALINATLMMTTEDLQNVDAHSLKYAVATYISIHVEKQWDASLTAEDKDQIIYKIFTEQYGGCEKNKKRHVDLKLLTCECDHLYQVYNFANVGKTLKQIKEEQKAQGPLPEKQKQCDAARQKFDVECNKIPQDGKPESEWSWRSPQDAALCLADTTSNNFKMVETLCNTKTLYPKKKKNNNGGQQEETTSQTIIKDEL